jgi:hypothetical protein
MVIGLLIVSAIPTTIGVCEALSEQKKANAAAKEKAKFYLTATVCLDDNGPVECWCVLKDGKVSGQNPLCVDFRCSIHTAAMTSHSLWALRGCACSVGVESWANFSRSCGSITQPPQRRASSSWGGTSCTRLRRNSWEW